MSSGIFSVGNSALASAYTALRTAGNNVANANTPGYSRQSVVMTPQVGAQIGGQVIGRGVSVVEVRRSYSEFLTGQAHQAASSSAEADMRATQLGQVARLFNNDSTGIGTAVDGFFSAVQDLAQRPADASVRQQLVGAGNLLTQRFNDVGNRLSEMRAGSDRQVRLEADTVNRLAQEIALLNDKISLARGSGASPNDLLDKRDAAIRTLNQSVRVSAVAQSDASINIFVGNGQPLVVGAEANSFTARSDAIDPQQLRVGIVQQGGAFLPIETDAIGGGRIGGLMQFRNTDLVNVENQIGRLALALTSEFNTQHRLGNDGNGAAGGDFFEPVAMSAVPASTNNNPATAATVTLADASQLKASDYRVDYDGSNYRLTRMSDGTTFAPSASPSFTQDGLTISLSGTPPAVGDQFIIRPFASAARDLAVAVVGGSEVAAASPVKASLASANAGTVVVDDLIAQGPARNPALGNAIDVVFTSGSAFEIRSGATVLAGGAYASGSPISFNGWSLTLRGQPQGGDRVLVRANSGASGDNRNALELGRIADRALIDGTALSGGYANIVANVGGAAQGAEVFSVAQASIRDSAMSAEAEVSGVNLDEEATRLIQYQQQYQAAAKVIAVGRTIFDEILSLAR
jgi:flagellar hook-associated protein 1 FlgK